MAVSLKKGQGISLRKDEFDLSSVTIGLGWDVAAARNEEEYDLDAIAFLLGKDGKIHDLGRDHAGKARLKDSDVIYFNNQRHPSGAIWLTGDNRTGHGDGDDEQIIVRLDDLQARYESIVFVVSIYHGKLKNQSFSKVSNAFIRAIDAQGKEICRYNISGDDSCSQYRSMTFAQVSRQGSGGWEFRAIGTHHETDRFVDVLKNYI